MSSKPIIIWLRRNLRLQDNEVLHLAVNEGRPLILVYIFDDTQSENYGGAEKWWLYHSLQAFQASLIPYSQTLILRKGHAEKILFEIAQITESDIILADKIYNPFCLKQDQSLKTIFSPHNISYRSIHCNELFEPHVILNQNNKPFQVFTRFWQTCIHKYSHLIGKPLPVPTSLPCYANINRLPTDDLNNWSLLPQKPNWARGFESLWKAGEKEALKKFESFLDNKILEYDKNRDRPDLDGTSSLSPHLKFGEISPRLIWHQVNEQLVTDLRVAKGAHVFLAEIGWREFAHYLLFHNPNLPTEAIKPEFRHFPWKGSTASLKRWQKGQTGYPIVDAAMRQLWHTGWMHNRCRMIVASFLVKHLLIDWRSGAKWFMDTLLDADEASNSMNWQWVAGCGVDASPYFRIFNPVLQGEKFDPNGDYVRKWVPELSKLSNKFIHKPWEAPEQDLQVANIKMGLTYPNPIVDHAAARTRALEVYKQLR